MEFWRGGRAEREGHEKILSRNSTKNLEAVVAIGLVW